MDIKKSSPKQMAFYDPGVEKFSPQQRMLYAKQAAFYDTALKNFLLNNGLSGDEIGKIRTLIEDISKLTDPQNQCLEIKRVIKGEFSGDVLKTVQRYRANLGEWIRGQSGHKYPPQFVLQQLPDLSEENISAYLAALDYYEEIAVDDEIAKKISSIGKEGHIKGKGSIDSISGEIKEKETWKDVFRQKMQSILDIPIVLGAFLRQLNNAHSIRYACHQTEMLNGKLSEYMGGDQKKALQIFEGIINHNSKKNLTFYRDVITQCIRELSSNEFFLASLFNFLGEYAAENPNLMSSALSFQIIDALINTGVCRKEKTPGKRDYSQPQSTSYIQLGSAIYLSVPSKYMPADWMGHRLINPALNTDFSDFLKKVDKNPAEPNETTELELEKWKNALQNKGEEKRRYGLNFDRMLVKDIPGLEDKEVWFHFFAHETICEDGEIPVEVVVNGASFIFIITEDCNSLRAPNGMKQLSSEWISEKAHDNLKYYLLWYAYELLVKPRSQIVDNEFSEEDDKPFKFLLENNEKEFLIPSAENRTGKGPRNAIQVRRNAPSPYIRRLPAGYKASEEKLERAAKARVHVPEGYTYVEPKRRGTLIGQNPIAPKKFRFKE